MDFKLFLSVGVTESEKHLFCRCQCQADLSTHKFYRISLHISISPSLLAFVSGSVCVCVCGYKRSGIKGPQRGTVSNQQSDAKPLSASLSRLCTFLAAPLSLPLCHSQSFSSMWRRC